MHLRLKVVKSVNIVQFRKLCYVVQVIAEQALLCQPLSQLPLQVLLMLLLVGNLLYIVVTFSSTLANVLNRHRMVARVALGHLFHWRRLKKRRGNISSQGLTVCLVVVVW